MFMKVFMDGQTFSMNNLDIRYNTGFQGELLMHL